MIYVLSAFFAVGLNVFGVVSKKNRQKTMIKNNADKPATSIAGTSIAQATSNIGTQSSLITKTPEQMIEEDYQKRKKEAVLNLVNGCKKLMIASGGNVSNCVITQPFLSNELKKLGFTR